MTAADYLWILGNACSPPLKHNHFICLQVHHLQFPSLFNDVGVFANQQPTDVGEEKPPRGVVGVCVRLRVLVMDAVVPCPLVYVILLAWRQAEIERITRGTHRCAWKFQIIRLRSVIMWVQNNKCISLRLHQYTERTHSRKLYFILDSNLFFLFYLKGH